jgi:hypothetical protein
MKIRINPFRLGLIALTVFAGSGAAAHAQSTEPAVEAPAARTFNAERWQVLKSTGEAFAGIRSRSGADLILLMCIARDSIVTLTFHPAPALGLSNPPQVASLAFDGETQIGMDLAARKALDGSILFVLHDNEPSFRAAIRKLETARDLEVTVLQAGAEQSRHQFTLRGSSDAITPVLGLCGQ